MVAARSRAPVETLVVCVDRTGDVPAKTGVGTPVAGRAAVESLVVDLGLADPEDSGVNALLEALRVADDLEDADVALVSGAAEGMVNSDRAVAAQVDDLLAEHDPASVVVVIDSAEDERLVPVIESRVPVDGVDRVVVRQARDLESTYYLLKQFLADEELRATVFVPLGIVLLVFPALMWLTGSLAAAAAAITAVIGSFLLYKGLGVDDHLADVPAQVNTALYSGQVSVVTYVVAAGLALVGVFVGVLGASDLGRDPPALIVATTFAFEGVPWLALSALAAATGRLVDEVISADRLRSSYLNLPFAVVSVGFVARAFSAYVLERAGYAGPLRVPAISVGPVHVESLVLAPEQRLAALVIAGFVVSLVGIRVSSTFGGTELEEPEDVAE